MSDEIKRLSDWDISEDIGFPDPYVSDRTMAELKRLEALGDQDMMRCIGVDIDHLRLVTRLERENKALKAEIEILRAHLGMESQ